MILVLKLIAGYLVVVMKKIFKWLKGTDKEGYKQGLPKIKNVLTAVFGSLKVLVVRLKATGRVRS